MFGARARQSALSNSALRASRVSTRLAILSLHGFKRKTYYFAVLGRPSSESFKNGSYRYRKSHTITLTNRPDFFMVCTLIDHRNDAIKCSNSSGTMSRRRVVSLPRFEHFMASFLWSKRVQTMKKSGRFVFYNDPNFFLSGICFIFRCEIVKTKSARALRCKSRHFHGLYSQRP